VFNVGVGSLCVKLNGCKEKSRRYVVAEGFGPDHRLGVYNNNTATIERAFVERYFLCKEDTGFRPALVPERDIWKSRELKLFRERVMLRMPRLPVMTEVQVVSCYTGAKKRTYEDARVSLMRRSLCARDAQLTSFVKFEKQDITKAPRVINPRSARYNLALGKYLKHAEKHFFRAINDAFGAATPSTVIKGYNAADSAAILRAKWDQFGTTVAIGLDASKFDMHVSIPALRYEHSFYRALFPDSKELRSLLASQERNKGVAHAMDGKVKFSVNGTRSSGDLNTSLGNCIIMCALVHAYAAERGVRVELANNGDDCVVFLEAEQLVKFSAGLDAWFRSRGFAMTMEKPVRTFEHLEFCQTHPVLTGGGWLMVRNHLAVLTKDPMCLVPVQTNQVFKKWLYAVGECGSAATPGVPVQSAFYANFMAKGVKPSAAFRDTIFKNTSWNQKIAQIGERDKTITPEARASYFQAFGVLPDAQVALEALFMKSTLDELDLHTYARPDHLESGLSLLQHSSIYE